MTQDANSVLDEPIASKSDIEETRAKLDRKLALARYAPLGYLALTAFAVVLARYLYTLLEPEGHYSFAALLCAAAGVGLLTCTPFAIFSLWYKAACFSWRAERRALDSPSLEQIGEALDMCKQHAELEAWRQKVVTRRGFVCADLTTMQAWVDQYERKKRQTVQRQREEAALKELHEVIVKAQPQRPRHETA